MSRYMLIDVTKIDETQLITTASSVRHAELLALLEKERGRKIIAPPLEGRGFSKLPLLQLQYYLWNSFQQTPPEDYKELVKLCVDQTAALVDDDSELEALERRTAHLSATLAPQGGSGLPTGAVVSAKSRGRGTRKVPVPGAPDTVVERPSGTSKTGRVWKIADACYAAANNSIDRDAIIAACIAEGINKATAGVQYSKWKKTKPSSK